jgi:DNA-binding CsgD family transcriptional regulator
VSPLRATEWEVLRLGLSLSTRESQIARLVLDDVPEEEIAMRLSISPHTVHAHMGRLYKKLQVHSRHQLVLRFFHEYVSSSAWSYRQADSAHADTCAG